MNKEYGIIGASGHAKVIIELLESQQNKVSIIVDADPSKQTLLQHDVQHQDLVKDYSSRQWIIAIGNNQVRERIGQSLDAEFGVAIGDKATISKSALVKEGTVIMNGVTINADSRIGKHCIVNTNASIDHDCVIEDYVHVSPNVALAGNVSVGKLTHIGIGASVIQGVRIGTNVTVGAGSVVISDIPDNTVVVGVPAKVIKQK